MLFANYFSVMRIQCVGPVKAGFPSPAADYLEDPIDLNELLIPRPLSTFFARVRGDSMNQVLPDNAIVIVDKHPEPKSGDIVVAVVMGEFTTKYYERSTFKCRLVPCSDNPKHLPIDIDPEMNFQVWGVVTGVVIDRQTLKEIRRIV